MRNSLVALLLALVFSVASLGAAQSPGFGIFSGDPVYLGAQFQTGGLRVGAGLSSFGIGATGDLILSEAPLAPEIGLTWYYGAGVSAYLYSVGYTGFGIFPHGLVGLEWNIPQLQLPFSFYGEYQIGFTLALGGISYSGLDFSGRSGIIFR